MINLGNHKSETLPRAQREEATVQTLTQSNRKVWMSVQLNLSNETLELTLKISKSDPIILENQVEALIKVSKPEIGAPVLNITTERDLYRPKIAQLSPVSQNHRFPQDCSHMQLIKSNCPRNLLSPSTSKSEEDF